MERWRDRYGPWTLVTGASEGIGRAIAVELARRGLNLVLVARRRPLLEELGRTLEEKHGVETRILALDLRPGDSIDALAEATVGLDLGLAVASAGFGSSGPFLDTALERELAMVDVNCRALTALCHHVAPRLARRGSGGLILMSSLVAFQGVPRSAVYAATKAYVQSLAEALRVELRPSGVDVLASAPGPVHSGFAERADMRMSKALGADVVAEATLSALGRRTTVRPGWLSKVLGHSLAMLPRWGRVHMMKQVMAGMTHHQDERAKSETRGLA
ncbi:MAG: SDR family oxidoreductase [Acidobacteriota bacterium]